MIPNRVVIAALDSALNRVDFEIRQSTVNQNLAKAEKMNARKQELIDERAALVEARKCVCEKRIDRP